MKKLLTILITAGVCIPAMASPYPYSPYGPAVQSRAWYPANPYARNHQYPMRTQGFNPWVARNMRPNTYAPVARSQYRPMQPQRQMMQYPNYNRWPVRANNQGYRGWGQPAYGYQARRSMPATPYQGFRNYRPMAPQMAYRNMQPSGYPQYRHPQNNQWQGRQAYARPYARMRPPQRSYPSMAQPRAMYPRAMYPRVAQRNYPAFNPNVPYQYQARMMPRNMYGPYRQMAVMPPMAYRQMQARQNTNTQRQAAGSRQWTWPRQNIATGQVAKPYGYQMPQRKYMQYPGGWNSRKVSYTK